MKNKIVFYLLLVIIIIVAAYLLIKGVINNQTNEIKEYIPQEEISEEQERQTLVTLYFQNIDTKNIMPEARLIDVKKLLDNPYETLLNLLIAGPKNENLEAIIPDGTKVNEVKLDGNVAIINFSEEFIKDVNVGKEQEERIIKSIVNTLTELNEIDEIKIIINGKEGKSFADEAIDFSKTFKRTN